MIPTALLPMMSAIMISSSALNLEYDLFDGSLKQKHPRLDVSTISAGCLGPGL